jgi:hypothetical protein
VRERGKGRGDRQKKGERHIILQRQKKERIRKGKRQNYSKEDKEVET